MKLIKTIIDEIRYLVTRTWTIAEVGAYWDKTVDYEEVSMSTNSYYRRFIEGFALIDNFPSNPIVLDICSRTGNGSAFLSRTISIDKVYCLDYSNEFIRQCRKKLSGLPVNFEAFHIDSYELPFESDKFDFVLCFESIEHVSEPGLFLKNIVRVSKKSAQIVLTTPNVLWEPVHLLASVLNIHFGEGPHTFIRRKILLDIFTQCGLRIEREKTTILIPGGPDWLIKLGNKLEKLLGEKIMKYIGLRRHFVLIVNP